MFNVLLISHILAGIVCLITGTAAMSARKKRGRHTDWGSWYHGAYIAVFATSVIMAIMHWETSVYLFYIAIFSYTLALYGFLAARRKWKNWLSSHIGGILGSYIAIVTVILVVNVPTVPVLNEWNPLIFWFLPTIIGSPLIFMVG